MTNSYLKVATALTAVLLTIGFTAAEPINPGSENRPDNIGEKTSDVGNTAMGKGMMAAVERLPSLPSQAADQAVTAVSTVQDFLNGSIGNLGNALSGVVDGDNNTSQENGELDTEETAA